MPQADFETKLAAARVWEERFAAWMRARGYWVLATYDFSGKGDSKAPKLLAPVGCSSLVLPDLQCFRAGSARWVECKYKERADEYRRGGYAVTGINLRHFRHYQKVQAATGVPASIAFMHRAEGEVRGATLAQLGEAGGLYSHTYYGPGMCNGGMIFWHYLRLPIVARLDEIMSVAA